MANREVRARTADPKQYRRAVRPRYATAGVVGGLALFVVLLSISQIANLIPEDHDKLIHGGVFFTLTLLVARFIPTGEWGRATFGLVFMSLLAEAVQIALPGRVFNPWGAVANFIGVLLGAALVRQVRREAKK